MTEPIFGSDHQSFEHPEIRASLEETPIKTRECTGGSAKSAAPVGPARLTDIVRAQYRTGRKPGDLTWETVRPIGVQSDAFDFKGLRGDDLGIIQAIVGQSELTPHQFPAAISPSLGGAAIDGMSELDGREATLAGVLGVIGAAPTDAGSNASRWCIVEQPHALCASPIPSDGYTPDQAPSGALLTIEGSCSSDHGSSPRKRESLPQIITTVLGALLIMAGCLMMTVPVWYTAHLTDVAEVGFSKQSGWLGLALILVGAALGVVCTCVRSSARRAQRPYKTDFEFAKTTSGESEE
jgi:hypothetical protein